MFADALNITFIIIIIYLWWLKARHEQLSDYFGLAIGVKLIAAFMSYWVYWHYYSSGDALQYFELAKQLSFKARQYPIDYMDYLITRFDYDKIGTLASYGHEPRTIFFVKILSVVMLFTSFKPWILSVYLSLFCLFAYWTLANQMLLYTNIRSCSVALALLFFPTLVFWGSGVLKEPIALGAMAFMISIFLKFYYKGKLSIGQVFLFLWMSYWLWQLRYFYAIPLLSLMAFALLGQYFRVKLNIAKWKILLIATLSASLIFTLLASFHPLFTEGVFWLRLWESYQGIAINSQEWAKVSFDALEPNAWSFIKYAPKALVIGMFSPMPWQAHNLLSTIVAVERIAILLLLLYSSFYWKACLKKMDWILSLSILFFVASMAIIIAFATPSFGSMVRFQAYYLPLLLLLVVGCVQNSTLIRNKIKD